MALLLTRRNGEAILIGYDEESMARGECITITILRKVGNQTAIAIDAPKELLILREELIGSKKRRALRVRE